jgi:hypothetical protein
MREVFEPRRRWARGETFEAEDLEAFAETVKAPLHAETNVTGNAGGEDERTGLAAAAAYAAVCPPSDFG